MIAGYTGTSAGVTADRYLWSVCMQRKTEQRDAIREAFASADRPLSPNEVLDAAQYRVSTLGIATVYRAIKALVAEGWLRPVEIPGEAARYELADLSHHHHFHCRQCNRVFDVEGCTKGVEKLAPPGFEAEAHEIILYGTCDKCHQETEGQ